MPPWIVILILLLHTQLAVGDQRRVEVFLIRSLPAAELVEQVRPLLSQGGSVSAYHDKLIVNAAPAELDAVRGMLARIDMPPRRLLIELRHSGQHGLSTRGLDYGIAGDGVSLGQAAPGSAGLSYYSAQTRGSGQGTQRIRALDGRPALIRSGQSVPVFHTWQQIQHGRIVQGMHTDYRDALSGFYALPRVHGEQVTVEIYQQHEVPAGSAGFRVQHASTVLNGRLGEWLDLGSIGGSDSDQQHAIGSRFETRRDTDRSLQLRVLAVD